MKQRKRNNLFLITTIILFQLSLTCFGQVAQSVSPLESFMKNKGVKNLASLAHTLNTYTSGTYSIIGNNILVEVSYRNGTTETIRLHYEPDGDYFENVRSTSGDEYIYSFIAAKTIVNAILNSSDKTCVERFFRTTFQAMSPEQVAAAVLTSLWWDWEGKKCN